MSRKKMFRNTIAIILTVLIGLMLPVQVFATTLPKDETVYSSFDNVQGNTAITGNIVTEISDERSETTKEFLLDDGTKLIAEYDQPIHYKDDSGNWVEYDNSLVAENSTSTADEADPEYSAKSNNIDIKLSNKAKSNNMIKISSDDYSISWGYDKANKSKINIIENNEALIGNEAFTTLKNITQEAVYEDVYKNVDLQYFISSTGVKENIILKDSDVQNEFNLTYKINNLTAKQTDDYTINLYNKENEVVYKILAPYMTDAKGNSSNQLKLEITSQKGSNLNVKLTADYWFIKSIGRSFPITIDPELTNKLSSKLSMYQNIDGSTVTYGPYHISGNSYAIAKIKSLPTLGDGEKIISAKFNFEATNGSTLFTSESDTPIIINAHKLTSLENSNSQYDATVIDYDSLTYNDNTNLTFDLTKTLNDWYDNGEEIDGFVLEAFDTVGSKQVNLQYTTVSSVTPSYTIVYKDFTGTESNLTYHTVPVGYNATAEVSDYLGNLVITQNLYEGTGSRMPVTITATYNSINYDKIFANGSPSGYGWQFSFNQYVRDASEDLAEAGYDYIYTDADGTDHYLKKSDDAEEWYDEDGLGITLTKTDTNLLIDDGTITQTYELTTAGGKLLLEKDEHNNTITYTYTDGNLTSITDGSGRVILITYYTNSNGDKRISKITRPDGNSIVFSYTNSNPDKLFYFYLPGALTTTISYNSTNMISSVEQGGFESGAYKGNKKVQFTYNSKLQVTNIAEYGSDNSLGNYLDISYGNDNTTVFSDQDGLFVTYTFDNAGNQISVLNPNGYLETRGNNGLSVSTSAESFTKNYITHSTEHGEIGDYYVKENGTIDGVTSTGGTVTIDSSSPTATDGYKQYFGTTSIKVNNPVTQNNSAFFTGAMHRFDDTSLNGRFVTLSAYVKTKDVIEIQSGGAIGASLAIKSFDENGNELSAVTSLGITGTHDWQRLSISMMRVPTNTRYLTIYCNLRNASGTAWFDCLQLEEYDCANDFNALQNGDFSSNDYWYTNDNQAITVQDNTVVINGEAGAYEEPTTVAVDDTESENNDKSDLELPTYSITTNYAVPDSYIFTYDEYGNVIGEYHGTVDKVIKKVYLAETEDATSTGATTATTATNTNIPSDTTASHNVLDNKYIYQNVQVGRPGVVFRLSGEAQADSVPLSNENRTFGIALNIYYKNSTIPETHYQEFNASTTRRQSIAMSVTPNDMEKEINYVAFAFVYGYNKNRMTIYNAMLNVSSIPLQTTDETTDSESSSNNTSNLDYDGYIYCEAVQESKNTNHEYIEHTKTYDSTGNYVTSETNQAGYAVGYTYDSNGNITSSTDAKGKVTNYTYDLTGNVTEVNSYNVENQYFYNTAGMLSSINHNSFIYQFNYDVYNNLVSTTIGDTALATNTYDENNGVLEKTTYANGDYLEYMYDTYDRIIRIKSESGTHSMFVYNKRGLVAKVVDVMNNRTTYYYYDLNGNVEKKYCQTEFGDMLYYVTTNTDGEIIEKTSVHGYEKTIVRGTLNGESYVESDGITVSRKTDDFDRLTKVTTTRDGYSNKFYTNYEYAKVGTTNATTNLVSKITQKKGDSQLSCFEYTYDKNGNIIQVKQNGTTISTYMYDQYNQMEVAYDRTTSKYTYYDYDKAGNITKVKAHDVVSGVVTGNYEEVLYTYTDNTWKDKLSSYDGQTITYDYNGNPLSYRDGMIFAWENGRILKKITIGDKEIEMYYDSNGIRIRKEDDNLNTNYFYDSDNNLTALSYEENTVYFYYDSEGLPTSMSFDDTMYYYIKNLQGDIVSIVNQNGDTVVTYTYDAFGKVTSKTDTTVYDIADLNPFRYRGYIYDNETGLYYLNSRYYDPETGRFINADIYCDTQSNIFGTNMFTYCNNNPVNQVDPEGTDAMWLQFPDGANGFGHTSLLVEDDMGVWWYFYWGPKHFILRPCGTSKFSLPEINSYLLAGFDPRPGHNYYVYSYNGLDEDNVPSGLKLVFDINYVENLKDGEKYYNKMHDGLIEKSLYIKGDFHKSYEFLCTAITTSYYLSNGNDLFEIFYENGSKYISYHVCCKAKLILSFLDEYGNLTHEEEYMFFEEIKNETSIFSFDFYEKGYNVFGKNCVQMSILALSVGSFAEFDYFNKLLLSSEYGYMAPNHIYNSIWFLFDEEKLSDYYDNSEVN